MQFKEEKKRILNETKFKDKKGKTRSEFDKYCNARYNLYKDGYQTDEIEEVMVQHYGDQVAKMFKQMHNAKMKQKQNTKDHISYLLNNQYNVYFLTLTFKDSVLNNTTVSARQKRIQRAVREFDDYIGNIDYGDETEREHFHFIVAFFWPEDNLIVNAKEYYKSIGREDIAKNIKNRNAVVIKTPGLLQYMKNTGFIYAEPLRINDFEQESKSKNKLSEYIAKLTAHSLKVKQSYITVKKGTKYQEYKKAWKELKQQNNIECENADKYVYLKETIANNFDIAMKLVHSGVLPMEEAIKGIRISDRREKQRMKWIEKRLEEIKDIEIPEQEKERTIIEKEDLSQYDYDIEQTDYGFITHRKKKAAK